MQHSTLSASVNLTRRSEDARLVTAGSLATLLALLFSSAACSSSTEVFGYGGGAGGTGGAWGSSSAVGSSSGSGSMSSTSSSSVSSSTSSSVSSSASSSGSSTASSSSSSSSSAASASGPSSSSGSTCPNGTCDPNETPQNCPQDCPPPVCAHDVCVDGVALDPNCDPCVQMVCNDQPGCCDNQWTGGCVSAAVQACGASCCGNGVCVGENCDSCVADCGACFCGNDECNGGESCGTCPEDCYDCPTCAHSSCTVSGTLSTTECPDACVMQVCNMSPGCCGGPNWDVPCQNLAQMLCTGGDACVASVCTQMPECCNTTWSQACVDLAKTQCSTQCNCSHSLCDVGPGGTPLAKDCDPCVASVCAVDDYCCSSDWDGICVAEVEQICFINCN